ncbi:P-loop containing nucleoside triphosphate hydrolase [Pseudocohnilembus persalinus]|uniref:p-loop containing nucleoside triphosphate hydrolase n=1 Tax=Pseudocohnilembus persalinus TaxID=266149 RepID=A0A0V0QLS5_PSEPJ|nr:P-loop containing nucleoside triphosphate hydrolase [Pseudocohnilembus persalinus]|eukprot:KRX03111.1 P-loop containing nucleoside triphosphate hydrolase [Pseudocohnilembus persalinus]
MANKQSEVTGKVILIGPPGVGKTSILNKLVYNDFKFQTTVTEKPENYLYTKDLGDKNLKLALWDTAGQEKFRAVSRQYYRNANAAFIVVSIEDPQAEKQISDWSREVHKYAGDVKKCILINKSDLPQDKHAVDDEMIENIKQEQECECYKVSAREGHNIQEAIDYIIDQIKV